MLKLKATFGFSRWKLTLLIIGMVLASLALSFLLCFYLGERFFFDKLFYKKSALHGYGNHWHYGTQEVQLNWFDRKIVEAREKDLTDLLGGKMWSKKPGVKTIAVIGDSYVYGTGIRSSQRFSNLLVPELKKHGITAEVYTFAEPSNSILDNLALYQLIKKQLNPDLVVLGIVSNDLFFNVDRYPGDRENFERFARTCDGSIFANADDYYEDNNSYFKAVEESFSQKWSNLCYLTEAVKILAQDPRLMYFSFSSKHSDIACHQEDASTEIALMDQYISELNFYGIRGLSHLSNDSLNNEYVSAAEGHFSANTHRKFAQEISGFAASYLQN